MHRYKHIYRIVQSIFLLTTAALLLFILLPVWLYADKAESGVTFSPVGSGSLTQGEGWITDYFKMSGGSEADADILFFRDARAVNAENEKRLTGKAVVFEMLFSQETLNLDAKSRIEYLAGASYSGFWGKTFEDLSDKEIVPAELISQYEKTAGLKWKFRGEGVIITDGSKIIVLRQGEDYKGRMTFRSGSEEMPYYGYFEITSGVGPYAGQFSIKLTDRGDDAFKAHGLPSEFPAVYVMRHNQYEGYYFAGDFSELNVTEPYAYETMPWLLGHKGIYERYNNEEVYWKAYYPLLSDLIADLEARKQSGLPLIARKEAPKSPFLADSEKFYIQEGKDRKPFFIKGVDLGAALPGRAFTEFPQEKETYYKWLSQMSELHVNTVRVYTLMPPEFYRALYEFNYAHESEPIYLLQEIWPEEKPEENNYLGDDYNKTYRQEIKNAVQAVHGDAVIPERAYRSWGLYAYDVSPYLIGYLVGRELEPDEVLGTDLQNAGYRYEGEYIYSEPSATPTESWLAESCDYALSLEDSLYQNKPLAAIVSWPTLDPLDHDSEWNPAGNKALQYNDKAVVNIEHIGMNPEKAAGFFGAYHIYPNYPDFMNNDTAYADYRDDQGSFRYGGYLQAFMNQHKKFPALVAEYGISTSKATAHYSPDGYHHGGLSETEQAEGIIRMTDAIIKEGYAGALVFEWMDEWAKKTWTTEYYMIPYNRHMLWHNVIDPEQNYGLLSYRADAPAMRTVYVRTKEEEPLKRVAAGQDASFLNIELTFENENAFTSPVSIALSTYGLPGEPETVWEFDVRISPEPAVLVNPGYNWLNGRYDSVDVPLRAFEELIQKTNPENLTKDGVFTPAKYLNLSRLPGLVTVEDQKAWIRLPYGLIGFSDPSSQKALYDPDRLIPEGPDQISIIDAPVISMKIVGGGEESPEITYNTISWDEPDYTERQKDGFNILADYFKKLQ